MIGGSRKYLAATVRTAPEKFNVVEDNEADEWRPDFFQKESTDAIRVFRGYFLLTRVDDIPDDRREALLRHGCNKRLFRQAKLLLHANGGRRKPADNQNQMDASISKATPPTEDVATAAAAAAIAGNDRNRPPVEFVIDPDVRPLRDLVGIALQWLPYTKQERRATVLMIVDAHLVFQGLLLFTATTFASVAQSTEVDGPEDGSGPEEGPEAAARAWVSHPIISGTKIQGLFISTVAPVLQYVCFLAWTFGCQNCMDCHLFGHGGYGTTVEERIVDAYLQLGPLKYIMAVAMGSFEIQLLAYICTFLPTLPWEAAAACLIALGILFRMMMQFAISWQAKPGILSVWHLPWFFRVQGEMLLPKNYGLQDRAVFMAGQTLDALRRSDLEMWKYLVGFAGEAVR